MKNQTKQAKKRGTVFDAIWDFLQFVCCLAGNCGRHTGRMWPREKKNRVRTALFFFFFLYMAFVYRQGFYQGKEYFKYHGLVFFLVLWGLVRVSWERELKPVRWNSAVARCYLLFWILVCVSDFVVSKRFRFVGYSMLFGMTAVFLVWQQMEHKEDLVRSFCHGAELFAAAGIVYQILHRAQASGFPDSGSMKNPEEYGLLSAFMVLVFLSELYDCWQNGKFGAGFLVFLCGAACSLLQVLQSGRWYAILYAGAITLFAVAGALLGYGRLPSSARIKAVLCIVAAIAAAGLYFAAVRSVPEDISAVLAEENQEHRLENVKGVVEDLNLFGHKQPNPKIGNKRRNPQSNILQIGYRYGLFAVLSYIALFGLAWIKPVHTLWTMRRNWNRTDLLAAGVFLLWWTVGLFANMEYPYVQPVWFLMYLLPGRYMTSD